MKLEDRVAIVTGTSPNIGGGIAEGLAAEGASVVCVDSVAENAQDCAAAIERSGARALALRCDVTREDQVESAVARAWEHFEGIDLLVNNAAFFNQKGVLDMPLEEWARQVEVILSGAFLFTQKVARRMVDAKRSGVIINIVSTAGHQGQPGNVAYCTAKSGLLNFTRSVAMELAPHGIRVNSLTPTATDPSESFERAKRWGRTPPEQARRVAEFMQNFRRGVPLQVLPKPSDYARAIVFLASDDAALITGADLRVDAGAVARYWAWNPSE